MPYWNKMIKEFDPKTSFYRDLRTVDEAEVLVTAFPNSAKAWTLYIIFHLTHFELDKARSIAERAIRTINFRQDLEKLDIFKVMLAIECIYGTRDSFKKVFDRAVREQDDIKIYQHVFNLYIQHKKSEELEKLVTNSIRKIKNDQKTILKVAKFYLKNKKPQEARNILDRHLQCCSKKESADVLAKFAALEAAIDS